MKTGIKHFDGTFLERNGRERGDEFWLHLFSVMLQVISQTGLYWFLNHHQVMWQMSVFSTRWRFGLNVTVPYLIPKLKSLNVYFKIHFIKLTHIYGPKTIGSWFYSHSDSLNPIGAEDITLETCSFIKSKIQLLHFSASNKPFVQDLIQPVHSVSFPLRRSVRTFQPSAQSLVMTFNGLLF